MKRWLTRTALFLLLLSPSGCDSNPSSNEFEDTQKTIIVLYTNDEHGWIEQAPETDGPARLMGVWRGTENYEESGDFLILSGGDNWTLLSKISGL